MPDLLVGLAYAERGQFLKPSYISQESGLGVSLLKLKIQVCSLLDNLHNLITFQHKSVAFLVTWTCIKAAFKIAEEITQISKQYLTCNCLQKFCINVIKLQD